MAAGVVFTGLSGWILVVLVATTLSLPYALRSGGLTYLERMRPHFWLGYAIAPLTLVHLWPAMSQGWVRQVGGEGLLLATAALVLTLLQVVLGLRLRGQRRSTWLRRVHFWTMATIVLLVASHVVLNSATLKVLLA